jgi:hypothetical protein
MLMERGLGPMALPSQQRLHGNAVGGESLTAHVELMAYPLRQRRAAELRELLVGQRRIVWVRLGGCNDLLIGHRVKPTPILGRHSVLVALIAGGRCVAHAWLPVGLI